MLLSTLVSAAVAATLLPSAAVADTADNGGPTALTEPVPDDLRALDDLSRIARQVQTDLALLRDLPFEGAVQVDFADRAWLAQAVRERWEATRPAERVALEERSAKMLGMLPARSSLREEELRVLEQTTAFFDRDEDRLYLLEPEGEVSPLLVAAGLSEALHERHLAPLWDPADETDGRWVREAVLRGSNIALLLLWSFEHLDHLAVQDLSELQRGLSRAALAQSPPYVWKPMLGLSLRGESFLRRTTLAAWISPPRMADLDQATREVPRSTEQILHPDKYWTTRRRDDPTSIRFLARDLPQPWTLAHEDTLGEMILSVLTQPFDERPGVDPSMFSLGATEFSSDLTAGWDGDRIALLESEAGTVVHLVTAWDTAQDGREFLAAVEGQREGMLENLSLLAPDAHGLRVAAGDDGTICITSWIGTDEGEVDCLLSGLRVVLGA